MSIEVQAIYENGILRPERPLPLVEHQRVTIVVHDQSNVARAAYGVIGWQGDEQTVRAIAQNAEFGAAESP